MAITKLLHLKQSKGTPSRSLKNCLNYIMNPDKTRNGYLIGGNAGNTATEVYSNMMETKQYFDKLEGRQGYHFIISFNPGETDPETAMNIAMEFCDSYIPDYESCYAVHEDQEHIHVHICFNSIDMMEGKKYHYENGKWKQEIQPIVDSLCIKYGLKPLEYDAKKPKLKKNYEQWEAGKNKPLNYDNRKDIDAAINLAADYQEFLELLGQKYEIRVGFSKKWNSEYFTMKGPGMKKGRRNYSLGKLYTVESIKSRIALKGEKIPLPVFPPERSLRLQIDTIKQAAWKADKPASKQAGYYMSFYWRMKNTSKDLFKKDGRATMEINQMVRDLEFRLQNVIHTSEDLEKRQLAWRLQLKAIEQEEKELEKLRAENAGKTAEQDPEYQHKKEELQQQAKQMRKQLAVLKKLHIDD